MIVDFYWYKHPVEDQISGVFKQVYDFADTGPYEHPGLDYASREGTPLFWYSKYPVKFTWHRPGDGWGNGSFGVCAVGDILDTPYYVVYAHLQERSYGKIINCGDRDRIGWTGSTGYVHGAHLHVGMSNNDPGFSPMRLPNGKIGNPRLLDPMSFIRLGQKEPQEQERADEDEMSQAQYLELKSEIKNLNEALVMRFNLVQLANTADMDLVRRIHSILRKEGIL